MACPGTLCSKTYKKASQLYLTRRLPESLSSLQPIITGESPQDEQYTNGDYAAGVAPIAIAPSTWRIKVWNLYITLLSAIVDLGAEEGKNQFGQKEWKNMATQVREGGIWDTVVQIGYQGREGSVDAEVVYNLATLLLNHSSSQALNQQRLETYLSAYGQPSDLADRLQDVSDGFQQQRMAASSGADTPKDLAARVRIIELFTLHVLPRNEEWEYATEFINLSEVLDEERKELFLQTLEGLKEEKERGELRAAELQRQKDAELDRQREEERRLAEEAAAAAHPKANGHKRNTSEVDYGIEKGSPRSSSKGKGPAKSSDKSPNGKSSTRTALSSSSSKNSKKQLKPEPRSQSRAVANAIRNLFKHIIQSVSGNPMSIVRTLLFVLGILMAMSRQDVRDRVRRITGGAWQKVKGTVGMGVKVSYI
ncbi:hypothetical protein N7509_011190 [Penicillium cosmopolitanum]|uniref:Peroxin 26 n=1 Tax=Penicillium cosmopolitanum TaxID=1131564 RepID=A0A9W9VT14_9EURO|nr:uncharacterized protein N7509_011190 [Penicillium cosmopolitanum]KAJ5388649.1 hypothetical protein N7509_011190 [Penicillium cosmopolitanum]